MAEWLGQDLEYVPQIAGDLGNKMRFAFDRSFELGIQRVVTIGIDCPDINQEILENAFDSLQNQDLVIGPARDGGYYLIGLNQTIPQLFRNINWGTEKVFKQTQNIAQQLNLSIDYLPTLSDVDHPEDLGIWENHSLT